MKVLIHFGSLIEEAEMDIDPKRLPAYVEKKVGPGPGGSIKALLAGKADGMPLYRLQGKAL